eukprot:TRINITY_DN31394_c0_g1_i3.p1 TRINITY_DN31394_c0_g1~~TRINITY_DN31394_c0_g1_i3.p1  ORF type:complete len:289 (-),score=30.08 TRINITY_DN31394_c0_g1_i3:138-920(-)
MLVVRLPTNRHHNYAQKKHLLWSVNPPLLIRQTRGQVSAIRAVETQSLETNVETSQKNSKRTPKPGNYSEAQKKRWEKDPSSRELASQAMKARWKDPVFRQKVMSGQQTDEARQKLSMSKKKLYSDPKERQKQSELIRKLWQDPSYRDTMMKCQEKKSETMKKKWTDPVWREKMVSCIRAGKSKQKQNRLKASFEVQKGKSKNDVSTKRNEDKTKKQQLGTASGVKKVKQEIDSSKENRGVKSKRKQSKTVQGTKTKKGE